MKQTTITTETPTMAPINREELIKTLNENRAKHVQEVTQTIEGFQPYAKARLQSLIDQFDSLTPDALAQVRRELFEFASAMPVNHSHSYDNAIKRCELTTGDVVYLSENKQRELINDQWGWAAQHRRAVETATSNNTSTMRGGYAFAGTEGAGSGRRSNR